LHHKHFTTAILLQSSIWCCWTSVKTKFYCIFKFFWSFVCITTFKSRILGVQISTVRFPKDSSSCCEWFIVRTEKRFFYIGLWNKKWIFYDNPKKKKYYAKPIVAIDLNTNGRTFIVRKSCSVSGGSCLLWTIKTWRFHYERSISATIDSFKLCIARKTVKIRAKTW